MVNKDAKSFMTVSDNGESTPEDYLFGFLHDKDRIKHPTESQIVMWRQTDSTGHLTTLHGLKGYTHFRGIHMHQLEEAGSGVFSLSSEGSLTRLPVEAVHYAAIQEFARLGKLEELLKLLKKENLYERLARHEDQAEPNKMLGDDA
ncbi:MAG: hypothetical protein ACR2RV_13140 [Verrucomicrobiales bacterium]